MDADIVIQSGQIIDGSGSPRFSADIAIKEGKISSIGNLPSIQADTKINASGLIICPGFIDMHSHSDLVLLVNPLAESKIRQGVTTEVIGNCGNSPAPLTSINREIKMESAKTRTPDIKFNWSSYGQYLKEFNKLGISLNVVGLVGHGTIRSAVMGIRNRAPTDTELEKMKDLAEESMKEGAFGMSTGLIQIPGRFSSLEELVEISKVIAKYKGFCATDTRGQSETMLHATLEAIDIAELADIPMHISHNVPAMAASTPTGRAAANLSLIDEARARGLDITCDLYAYIAAGTGIRSLVPPWNKERIDPEMYHKLKDDNFRDIMKEEMIHYGIKTVGSGCRPLFKLGKWENILLANCKINENLIGKNFAEIAQERGVDPIDAIFDVFIEEKGSASIVCKNKFEEDVEITMKHPSSMMGSDGVSLAPYGILGKGKNHPRSYGNYPRVIAKYVRERKILTLEEAVKKMTSFPAWRLGLTDRGLIKEGMWADIVVFNEKTILDKATFDNPYQYPEGIEYVMVNGKLVIEKNKHTGALPGIPLIH